MGFNIRATANGWIVRSENRPTPIEEAYVFNEFKDASKFLKDNLKLKDNK